MRLATKEAAEEAPRCTRMTSIAVTIHLSGNLDDVVKFLENNGSSASNVGEDYIEAHVPVITARADLQTTRRHPGAGNHPSRGDSERASGSPASYTDPLTDQPHGCRSRPVPRNNGAIQ